MTKVSMSAKLPVPAEKVWNVIGGFNALPTWHPAVKESKLDAGGRVRTLELAGGGNITERLEHFDEEARVYSYSIAQGPLPVANYLATIEVKSDVGGKGCSVEWRSEFVPSGASETDAVKMIQGIYQAAFDSLKKMFSG
jgi:uncharacterized protein YndB with AHSA1/START domain